MSQRGNRRTLLIVDHRPLRRALLAHFLEEFAARNDLTIVPREDVGNAQDELVSCALVIFALDSHGPGDPALRRTFPDLPANALRPPLVFVAEQGDIDDARHALEMGASAYIPMSTSEDVFFLALRSVLSEGSFFPVDILRKIISQAPMIRSGTDEISSRTTGSLNGRCPGASQTDQSSRLPLHRDPPPCREQSIPELAPMESLTSRQRQVLEGLRRAWSNKEIARALNMSEATVKVHVRQVMRKLGASNRTHAAILAAPNGASSRPDTTSGGIKIIQ